MARKMKQEVDTIYQKSGRNEAESQRAASGSSESNQHGSRSGTCRLYAQSDQVGKRVAACRGEERLFRLKSESQIGFMLREKCWT